MDDGCDMNGHEPIIKMRMDGKKPSIVFINDFPCECHKYWHKEGDHASISIHGDDIDLLDMRFLVGLTVSATSIDERRAKQLFEKCKQSGASVVGCGHYMPDKQQWEQSGWTEIWRREKSNG